MKLLEFDPNTTEVCEQRIPEQREVLALCLAAVGGFLLAQTIIYGSRAPFGVSFLHAQQKNRRLLATAAGVLIGTCAAWNRIDSIRYLAAALIAMMLKLTLRQVFRTRTPLFAMLSTGLAIGLTGLVWHLTSGGGALAVLLDLAELMLSMAAAAVFSTALHGSNRRVPSALDSEKQFLAQLVLLALCGAALPGFSIGGLSIRIGCMAAVTLVLAAAYAAGAYGGTVAGLAIGLTMDLTGSGVPLCTALYALGGLTAGWSIRGGRVASALTLVAVHAVAILLLPTEAQSFGAVIEAAVGAAAFALLPAAWLQRPISKMQTDHSGADAHIRRHMQARLQSLAGAYDDLAKTMEPVQTRENAQETDWLAEGLEASCGRCENRTGCIREMASERNGFRAMMGRGRAEPADFCESVRTRCSRLEDVCACLTLAIRAGRERHIRKGEYRDNRALLSRQYGQLSALLDAEAVELSNEPQFEAKLEAELKRLTAEYGAEAEVIAYRDGEDRLHVELCGTNLRALNGRGEELAEAISHISGVRMAMPEQLEGRHLSCMTFSERPECSCQIGATAEKRRGERISGDCGTYFTGKDGSMYVVLCDGMGSGTEAREEAVRTVKLLESFLRAGIEPGQAVDIIRSSVQIRSDGENFATVDIAVVHPKTGELHTIKYRAAPTFLRRKCGNAYHVRILGSKPSMEEISVTRTALTPGDLIVLTSDGVLAGQSPEEFCSCLKKLHCDNPRELSELLLRMAKTDDNGDDRTVIVLHYTDHELPVT